MCLTRRSYDTFSLVVRSSTSCDLTRERSSILTKRDDSSFSSFSGLGRPLIFDQSQIRGGLLVAVLRDRGLAVVDHLLGDLVTVGAIVLHLELSDVEEAPLVEKIGQVELSDFATDLDELELIANGVVTAPSV